MADPQRSYPLSSYRPIPCVEHRTLWCLFLGDRSPFKVTLPLNVDADVDDLRELIHIKGIDTTKSSILAKDLILWKLNESEPLEPNDTFSDRISVKISSLSKVATKLGPSQKLSVVFSQQRAQGSLHVIVQMPPNTHDISSEWSHTGDVLPDKDASRLTSLSTVDYSLGNLQVPCSPSFDQLRAQLGPYLVDKTALIERIVNNGLNAQAHLVLRPRRCGKTTMLQMLKFFFCIPQNGDPHQLFQGLYIAKNNDLCQKHMGKYAVMFLDMKTVVGNSWEDMFWSFREMVSNLYKEWYKYLLDSLSTDELEYFESICLNKAAKEKWTLSLNRLCAYLAEKSQRKVMVFIDEYEAPNNCAYEQDFFKKANEFFGHDVLLPLLKTNRNLQYAILAGVTPTAKSGWYSGLNNLKIHTLHTQPSIFAGALMFTEEDIKH